MLKAYCAFQDFNKEAQKIITSNNIGLTINQTDNKPTEEDLVKLIDAYDILIIGVASKFTADMIQFVKKPLLIATLSVGIDHIAEEFFYSPPSSSNKYKTSQRPLCCRTYSRTNP